MMEENIFRAECKPLMLDAYRQHFSFGIVYVEKARSSTQFLPLPDGSL